MFLIFNEIFIYLYRIHVNFKWQNQKTNQVETGMRRTSSGNFKINLFSINIGMTFYL